jgi:hypothetical protein
MGVCIYIGGYRGLHVMVVMVEAGSSRRVGPVLQLTRSRPSVGRSDTSCRDPETSQRQRLGAHEPCWPQDLLRRFLVWSRHDGLALPLLPLHVPHPPSPCSSCPPSMPLLPLRSPQAPPPKVCTCAAAHRPAPGVSQVGCLMRPGHSTPAGLFTGREGVSSVCSKPG